MNTYLLDTALGWAIISAAAAGWMWGGYKLWRHFKRAT